MLILNFDRQNSSNAHVNTDIRFML